MRNPVLDLRSNLVFSRSGTVWATWQLQAIPYAYKSIEEKKEVRDLHKELFQALRGEGLLLGLCTEMDPASIVLRMIEGLDPENHPAWMEEVEARYEALQNQVLPGERTFWLSVPLPVNPMEQVKMSIAATLAKVREWAALPKWRASDELVQEALDKANRIFENIPTEFQARLVTPAENIWIHLHSQQRGSELPTVPPAKLGEQGVVVASELGHTSGTAIPKVHLDESGKFDGTSLVQKLTPWNNRYLRVQSEDMEAPSYQVLQTVASTPTGGYEFPGVEWVQLVSSMSDQADFGLRLQISTSAESRRKSRKAEKNLEDQSEQRSDAGALTGHHGELDAHAENLGRFVHEMGASEQEVEVQVTAIFAVGGPSAHEARQQAEHIRKQYKKLEFRLVAPIGYQQDLWWSMLPGTPTTSVVREYAQIQTGTGFASAVPMGNADAGDESGILLAKNITTAHQSLLFLDPASPMATDASGSIAICGSLGSGKSHLEKLIAGSVHDRGGVVTVIDRSKNGEWEAFAASIVDPTVASVLDPQYSLDPLRLFAPARAARSAQMFFGTLLNIEPMSGTGAALSAVLSPDYLERHQIASSGALLQHLKSPECTVPGKESISGLMDIVATKDYGAVIFDEDLPAMPTDSSFIVFRTIGVELPRHEELASDHRFRNLPVDKKFGSSIYGLILEISRELCLADRTKLAAFIVDEAHHITGFPAGEEAVSDFLRVARKDLAFLVLGSHDPSMDFGSETLRGLINIRILLRQESKILAARSLEFLELDFTDQQLLDLVRKELSPRNWKNPETGRMEVHPERRGEGLIRDSSLRYAKIRILPAARPDRAEAALTTPPMPNEMKAA